MEKSVIFQIIRFWLFAVIAGVAALFACAPFSEPRLLLDMERIDDDRAEWKKYGAYYRIDELFVEASYFDAAGYVSGPVNRYIVNKQLRILTTEGTQYASVPVRRYGWDIEEFHCALFDSSGRKRPLNSSKIRDEYMKSGIVVFPTVSVGSLLCIYIEFESNAAIPFFEHWFSCDIPVETGRFTFSHLDKFEYDFKCYGGLQKGKIRPAETGEHTWHIWTVDDILPRARIDYQAPYDVTEPRMSAALRYAFERPVISDWTDLTDGYEDHVLGKSYFNSTRALREVVDSIAEKNAFMYEKADAVLAWAQENISYEWSGLESIDPDEVLAKGKGNVWELAVVMREMYEHLGLETDVVITRSREYGGFDEHFVTPSVLAVPLVTVTIDEAEFVAFPFRQGGTLGEYPLEFFDLKCLSLETNKPRLLPGPVSRKSYFNYSFIIDLAKEPPHHTLEIGFKGYSAYYMRTLLLPLQPDKIKEAFQKTLANFGTSNRLIEFDLVDLDKRGEGFFANITFDNPMQSISRKGQKRIGMSHLFRSYFASYDTSRSSPFYSSHESMSTESVRILKPPGSTVECSFPCRECENDLFSLTCTTNESSLEMSFSRLIDIKKHELEPQEMKEIYDDIVSLNKIEEANVIVTSPPGK
ncbi:MAG: hypothetical protein GF350_02395 [Chitinivibrionales bacterium]|nr:hypothetical protein [Chitinivibrionales bacterium]